MRPPPPLLSPGSVVASPDGGTLYLACESAAQIAAVDFDSGTVIRTMPTPDSPTLIELWRSAPYLHNGSAATIHDVLTTRNPEGRHGDASGLNEMEIDELCVYILSL